MSKEFYTQGKIIFDFEIDIEADTEEEAEKLAISFIEDYYKLDRVGGYHRKENVKLDDVITGEYED